MGKRSKTKYIQGHGYISYIHRTPSIDSLHGDGIGDIFSSIFKAGSQVLTKIPSKLIDASKSALVNVGSSTIKAVGSKAGDAIANKIVSKNVKQTPIPDQELRRQILKELTFDKPANSGVSHHKKLMQLKQTHRVYLAIYIKSFTDLEENEVSHL